MCHLAGHPPEQLHASGPDRRAPLARGRHRHGTDDPERDHGLWIAEGAHESRDPRRWQPWARERLERRGAHGWIRVGEEAVDQREGLGRSVDGRGPERRAATIVGRKRIIARPFAGQHAGEEREQRSVRLAVRDLALAAVPPASEHVDDRWQSREAVVDHELEDV